MFLCEVTFNMINQSNLKNTSFTVKPQFDARQHANTIIIICFLDKIFLSFAF